MCPWSHFHDHLIPLISIIAFQELNIWRQFPTEAELNWMPLKMHRYRAKKKKICLQGLQCHRNFAHPSFQIGTKEIYLNARKQHSKLSTRSKQCDQITYQSLLLLTTLEQSRMKHCWSLTKNFIKFFLQNIWTFLSDPSPIFVLPCQ